MPRGGKRDGAGRPSVWQHKETKLVRIPVAIADQLMDIAHKLDRGEVLDFVTNSVGVQLEAPTAVSQMTVWEADKPTSKLVEELPSIADGKRWLTTTQAFERAKERGCERNLNGFKGWSRRSPDKCLELHGLRKLSHHSNSKKAPGYEDTRWGKSF